MLKQPEYIKNMLLYGGANKQEYKRMNPLISHENYRVWRLLTIILEFVFIGLFIFFYVSERNDVSSNYAFPFLILAGSFVIISVAFLVFIKDNSKLLMPTIYLSMMVIFGTLIYCCYLSFSRFSVLCYLFILAFSILIVDKPYRYPCFVLIISIIMSVMLFIGPEKDLPLSYLLLYLDTFAAIGLSFFNSYIRFKDLSLRRNAELQRDIDSLTGVKNKLAYEKRINDITEMIENDIDPKFAVIVFDVNGLKITNDTYGHDAGDQLLIRATSLIVSCFPHSELFRIGGDEFAMVVTSDDYENREKLLNNLILRIAEIHKKANNVNEDTSIAAGLAEYDCDVDEDYTSVFQRADEQMYKNKKLIKEDNEFLH